MIKSTPYISSSGKAIPQSITIISSSYSIAVIFFPISPNPPSGIILIVPSFIYNHLQTNITKHSNFVIIICFY